MTTFNIFHTIRVRTGVRDVPHIWGAGEIRDVGERRLFGRQVMSEPFVTPHIWGTGEMSTEISATYLGRWGEKALKIATHICGTGPWWVNSFTWFIGVLTWGRKLSYTSYRVTTMKHMVIFVCTGRYHLMLCSQVRLTHHLTLIPGQSKGHPSLTGRLSSAWPTGSSAGRDFHHYVNIQYVSYRQQWAF